MPARSVFAFEDGHPAARTSIGGAGVESVFFFQAEDGIRVLTVTGVQTCALPISRVHAELGAGLDDKPFLVMQSSGGVASAEQVVKKPITTALSGPAAGALGSAVIAEIGRGSCRERV